MSKADTTQEAAGFIHLRARSAYSLLESMLHVKDLAKLAAKEGMPALGLADSNNLFGALEFSEAAAGAGVQPIIGCTLTVKTPAATGELALFAQNADGYARLMQLSSQAHLDAGAQDLPHVPLDRLLENMAGLIALTGGPAGPVAALLQAQRREAARALMAELARAFPGRLYVELQRHGEAAEAETEGALVDIAYDLGLPLVAANDIRFAKPADHRAHDALSCIAGSTYLGETERTRISDAHYFKSAAEMRALFADLPEAIDNTVEIARRCAFRAKKRSPILPRFTTEAGRDEPAELRAQAEAGLRARLEALGAAGMAANEETYWQRLRYELDIIIQMQFAGYFLIVADFIQWAKGESIPVGPGRGSGAGSLVAWALTITDLDPLRFGLLFERFLNPERVSMPDFDIDFCQERRGEVIDYVKRRYGADRVAQIITFGTLQARAVLRDVGRVMQLPFGQVDRLAKLIPANPANPVTLEQALEIEPRLKEAAEQETEVKELIVTALQLEGLHRNASTHAAGVVIGDRPLTELVALYRDPRSDLPATQFNMKWVEAAGLVKFDFLGLKTLTVLDRALKYLKPRGVEIELARIPFDDAKTYELMQSGATYGVFQLEGQGMRDTLRKVKPTSLEDIIALVSLYRPGPMKNIDTYANVKHGIEQPNYPHPLIQPILEETYGVIIYQEQVMQIAQVLSGYSLGEADLLRRAMGKKQPEEMRKQKSRFMKGAHDKGVSERIAEHIFDLVAEFAGYGFNKSHAAAYAVVAYHTAYLKAHYPVEFIAASMSLDLSNSEKLAAFHQDARRMGVRVLAPDINASEADFSVEAVSAGGNRGSAVGSRQSAVGDGQSAVGDQAPSPNGAATLTHDSSPTADCRLPTAEYAIRYALGAVRNVGLAAMQSVEGERKGRGRFKSLFDFAERLDPKAVNRRQLENLAKAGAFDAVEAERARVFAACEMLAAYAAHAAQERESAQASLFGAEEPSVRPPLPKAQAWSAQERLDNERESVGFYLSGHPLSTFYADAPSGRYMTFADLCEEGETEPRAYSMAGVLRQIKSRPAQSGGMLAWTTFSDPTGEYEAIVMPEHYAAAREKLEVGKNYVYRTRVRWRDGDLKMAADTFEPIEAAEARTLGDLRIVLKEGAPLEVLAATLRSLAPPAPGEARALRLILRLNDGREVEVSPRGAFPAGPGARAAMKAARGVERVM